MPVMESISKTFDYDPDTGQLTYREPRGTLPAGRPAGTVTKGGINVRFCGSFTFAHRIIWHMMTGEWPQHPVRHINGDKTDNRWSNLEVRVPVRERDPVTRKPIQRKRDQVLAHGVTRVYMDNLGYELYVTNAIVNKERVFVGRFRDRDKAFSAFRSVTGQEEVPHTL